MENSRLIFTSEKKVRVSIRILLWFVVFVLLTFGNFSIDIRLSAVLSLLLVTGMVVLTSVNLYIFIPQFYKKKHVFVYFLVSSVFLVGLIWLVSTAHDSIYSRFMEWMESKSDPSLLDTNLPSETKSFFGTEQSGDSLFITSRIKTTFLYICVYLLNFIFFYYQKIREDEDIRKRLIQERTSMELNFLRSQINPHFLFNALNNIYSMVYMNDKNAPDSILALSEMLRYITDESSQNMILVKDEINYIENYIRFQKLSFEENNFNLFFEKDVKNENAYISPMLLEPFVENGFKYSGVGILNNTFLRIILKTEGNSLYFETQNSMGVRQKKGKTEREGVGMQNVIKRLNLLYPGTHKLEISDNNSVFRVQLWLPLAQNKKE